MTDRPRVVRVEPPRGAVAALGTTALRLTFDRPMDTRRGRVRLVWGRISAHHVNRTRRHWRYSVMDRHLRWEDPWTLALSLETAPVAGFRVRVEWSDLRSAESGLPPAPAPREQGLSYVLAFMGTGDETPPAVATVPAPGCDLRPDAVIELLPDRPVARFHWDQVSLTASGRAVPFTVRTNRNPPDWRFLHFDELLPPGPVSLVLPAGSVLGAHGVPNPSELLFQWTVPDVAPVPQRPVPEWSEPPDGFADHPADRFEASLRFAGRPVLADDEGLADRIRLVDEETGAELPGVSVDHRRTPGHYATVFVRGTAELPELDPGRTYALRWAGLEPPGWPPAPPGALRFTVAEGVPAPVVPLGQAFSIFATPAGSYLQPVVSVTSAAPVRSVEVIGADDSWRIPLRPRRGGGFTDAFDVASRASRVVTFQADPDRTRLPDADRPGDRRFDVVVRTDAHERVLRGHAFDMTKRAVTDLQVEPGGHVVSWSLSAPADSQYLSLLGSDGAPLHCALLPASASRYELPAIPPAGSILQLWLVRARPEDDLWDYAVRERIVR